jgi:EAL domain-containing protein (putative c-di-GMP-specific phosphodiesterase class I)
MRRLSSILIAVCMALIAGSIGGVLFLAFKFDGRTAAIVALAALADLLARCGIDLIAERIENDCTVLDLLDYDVRFGEGFLFSQLRPVRAEALQGNEVAAPAA